jgi:hypothetical protein
MHSDVALGAAASSCSAEESRHRARQHIGLQACRHGGIGHAQARIWQQNALSRQASVENLWDIHRIECVEQPG